MNNNSAAARAAHFVNGRGRVVALLAVLVGMLGTPQVGAAVFTVEGAQLVAPGRCELSLTYFRAGRDADTDYLSGQPSCNVTGNLELSAELARNRTAGEVDTEFEAGFKTLARQLAPGDYGWGFGMTSHWAEGVDPHDEVVAYIPLSVHVADTLVMHYNIGWATRSDLDDAIIWGVRAEHALHSQWTLNGEAYGTDRGGTELQVGIGFQLAAATFQFGYGRVHDDRRDDWWMGGVSWAF